MNNTTLQYVIRITPDQIPALIAHLAMAKIPFDPQETMVHIPKENLLDKLFTGADAEDALTNINTFLAEESKPTIPKTFTQMGPQQRQDFLELINLHTHWLNDYPYLEVGEIDQKQLRKFQDTL